MSGQPETYTFQAEARQLLDLMIHSVYSNKDIFLRELISNSSDALDRRRFEAVSKPELLPPDTELAIRIDADPDARTLTVHDTGIGMSREEVVELIGTIAKSGTREFLDALKQNRDAALTPEMIGQFGVGFYSCFMVAGKVTLVTRKAGENTATRWESTGDGTYTIQEVEREVPGTSITLHLKPSDEEDGLEDYTREWKIREIIKKYSDFVAYPIQMEIERREIERGPDGKPVVGAEEETVRKLETLNSMKAIWLRPKEEASQEEYNEFYKHIAHDWTEPLEVIRAKIEGTLEYQLLLFIPAHAPMDLFLRESRRGVQLYVKRVFIMDDCRELLPEYLRFIRGVVDSEDLSLNISREILQQDRQIQRMRRGITGKVLDALKQMLAQRKDDYLKFWREFGRVLKEGLLHDTEHRETLLNLVLCHSTESSGEWTSLREYTERMKPDQSAIYYMTGEDLAVLEQSPHLEAFRAKGYEVLLLTDAVDDIWTQSVPEYDGKPLKSAGKGAVELGSEQERAESEQTRKQKEQEIEPLFAWLKEALSEYVKDVRLSSRLTTSPACLVGDTGDISPQLEQLLRAANQDVPHSKRILELNPGHPLLERMAAIHGDDASNPRLTDYAQLLYGQAVLAEGGQPPNPAKFSQLVADLMVKAM